MAIRLKYSGGSRPGVDVTHEDGRTESVEYLHEIEVTAAVRDNLLAQDPEAWSEVKPAPQPKPKDKE